MLKILKYLEKYKFKAIFGLLFKLLAALMELSIPMIMANTVNNMAVYSTLEVVLSCVLIIFIVLVNFGFDMICQYLASVSSSGIGQEIRSAMYRNINAYSFAELDKFGASSLITRVSNDVTQIQQAVAMGIRLLSRAPFIAIGAIIMAMSINFKLSLIFLIVVVAIFAASLLIRKITVPMYGGVQAKLDDVTSETKENLEGARVTRAFNMQNYKKEEFEQTSQAYGRAVIKVNKISAILNPITYLIINIGIILTVWLGGKMAGENLILKGDILALVSYLLQVLLAMTVMSMLIVVFTRAEASAKRVNSVLETQSTILDDEKDYSTQSDFAVEFEGVSFAYAGRKRNTLTDITVQIKKGERIGIIGGTGQGKSTLINLIPRFYDVGNGRVLVNGKDVKDWDIKKLREYVCIAPQKAVLLSGTIEENIRIGNENATMDEIVKSARIAEAEEFIEKCEGKYAYPIEQEGRNFSGGQKQRLSLARAFVRNCEVLIIDDSLSALDLLTDAKVRENLNREFAQKTLIFVSQRVSTLKNCDKIIVMEGGEITDIGNHESLIAREGLYSEIALSQSGR